MKLKNDKGSITIFVLVGLLFMSAFLIISYASNVNKSKVVDEQSNIIDGVYLKNDNVVDSYTDAYTALRKKNTRIFSFKNEADADKTIFENTNTVELTKTFEDKIRDYRIYGATGGVGDSIEDTTDENYGKYKIPIKINEKNYIEEEKYSTSYGVTINEYEDYYEVTTNLNANGIYWEIDGDFKVGDKINAQAKVLYVSSADETINDSVTLRIRNITKGLWIHTGRNGKETEFSTITMGEQKTLKLSEVELTSDNFTEGDIIAFNISRGLASAEAERNTITFNVYKGTIALEKNSDSQSGVSLSGEAYNIFLDSPLEEGDYIDYKLGKVIRADGTEEVIDLPELSITEDYTKIKVSTSVKPSKIEVEYVGYTIE